MPTGIDIDNTIANTDLVILRELNAKFRTHYTQNAVTDASYAKSLKLPKVQEDYLNALFDSETFYASLPAILRAVEGVDLIAEIDEIYYVSTRPAKFADVTMQWLDKHRFPVGQLYLDVDDKAGFAVEHGLEAFVEDCPNRAKALANSRIPVYLLSYPWNRQVHHGLITTVSNWAELIDIIQEG
jgi:uncharacterized HAD superfamily protein